MPVQLDSGVAFIEQAFEVALDAEDEVHFTAKGRAQVDDLSLREVDKRTIAAWQSVAVEDTEFVLEQQQIRLGKVLLNGVNSSLTLAQDGSSWLDIFTGDSSNSTEASTEDSTETQDWRVIINEIELHNNQLTYHEGTLNTAFRISLI